MCIFFYPRYFASKLIDMETHILIYGKNQEIIEVLERVINKNDEWIAINTTNYEELVNILSSKKIDILLFSSGIKSIEMEKIEEFCLNNHPNLNLLHHYGGGSGLLKAELTLCIENNNPIGKLNLNRI